VPLRSCDYQRCIVVNDDEGDRSSDDVTLLVTWPLYPYWGGGDSFYIDVIKRSHPKWIWPDSIVLH
jgi:hypothetical protein